MGSQKGWEESRISGKGFLRPFQPPSQEPFGFITYMIHAFCRYESAQMEVGEREA